VEIFLAVFQRKNLRDLLTVQITAFNPSGTTVVPDVKKTLPIRGPHWSKVPIVRLGGSPNPAWTLSMGADDPKFDLLLLSVEDMESYERPIRGNGGTIAGGNPGWKLCMIRYLLWRASED